MSANPARYAGNPASGENWLRPYPHCRQCRGRGCAACEFEHMRDHLRASPQRFDEVFSQAVARLPAMHGKTLLAGLLEFAEVQL